MEDKAQKQIRTEEKVQHRRRSCEKRERDCTQNAYPSAQGRAFATVAVMVEVVVGFYTELAFWTFEDTSAVARTQTT